MPTEKMPAVTKACVEGASAKTNSDQVAGFIMEILVVLSASAASRPMAPPVTVITSASMRKPMRMA